jgi:hypothetical protein
MLYYRALGQHWYGWANDKYICMIFFTKWNHLSLGIHIDLLGQLELHLPLCFIRMGRKLKSAP